MCRTVLILASALTLLPVTADAIQLRWSSGPSNISCSAATRCTLLVQRSGSEPFPSEWTLLYATKSPASPALWVRCERDLISDTASVSDLAPPRNQTGIQAGQQTAYLDWSGATRPYRARYILDLAAPIQARLELIAFRPTNSDSTAFTIVRSPEVTINGGPAAGYPPVILRTVVSHPDPGLRIRAAGWGLNSVTSASLTAANGSWTEGLSIVDRSDSTLTVEAPVASELPPCMLVVRAASGVVAVRDIPGESLLIPLVS